MLRIIRLTLAGLCLAMAATSIFFWVRSYSIGDSTWSGAPYASLMSDEGLLIVNVTGNPLFDHIRWSDFVANYETHQVQREDEPSWWQKDSVLGFGYTRVDAKRKWVNFPYWLPVLLLAATGSALLFRIPRRFNLLTCFVAMTLLAFAMGACVCFLSG